MRLLPRLLRAGIETLPLRSAFWVLLVLGLAGLEVVGRRARSDVEDGYAALFLALLLLGVGARFRAPLRRLGRRLRDGLRRRFLSLLERWSDIETDLRERPPLPRGLPADQLVPALVLGLTVPLLAVLGHLAPFDLRSLVAHRFYVGYLLLLVGLWTLQIAAGIGFTMLSWTLIRVLQSLRDARGRPQTPAWILPAAFVGSAVFGFLLAPSWATLAIGCACWSASALVLLLPGAPRLLLVWRDRQRRRRTANWSHFAALQATVYAAFPFAIALLAGSPAVLGGREDAFFEVMPVTGHVSVALAWIAASSSLVMAVLIVGLGLAGRRRDPARTWTTRIHVRSEIRRIDEDRIAEALAPLGGRFRVGGRATRKGEVALRVVAVEPVDWREQQDWPPAVGLADLGDPELHARLARRDDIQRRRAFFKGLRRLLKDVPASGLQDGEGLVFAPQHWFSVAMIRDEGRQSAGDDRQAWRSETIGPEYRHVMSLAARSHFHRVARALEIDLVYIERGVRPRQIERALRILFDVFDMHGGSRSLDDRDLSGIPGLRAVIHAFDFEERFRSEVYPEPHYDGAGRARVLHLFRDRGEEEVPEETPSVDVGAPIPQLLGV